MSVWRRTWRVQRFVSALRGFTHSPPVRRPFATRSTAIVTVAAGAEREAERGAALRRDLRRLALADAEAPPRHARVVEHGRDAPGHGGGGGGVTTGFGQAPETT